MPPDGPHDTEFADDTIELLTRARAGDRTALDRLFDHHVPILRRWASGRLPRWARDAADTSDLVQDTVIGTLKQLDRFEPVGQGALQAYLRQAVMNRVRNSIRGAARRPAAVELESHIPDVQTSPLEAAIGRETLETYERGLERLRPGEREAIIGRVELGMSYADLAAALGKPSANAARMTVVRALVRLAAEMNREPS
jgi:RNA polymerase sigma-70 factor (ECF subfamily)